MSEFVEQIKKLEYSGTCMQTDLVVQWFLDSRRYVRCVADIVDLKDLKILWRFVLSVLWTLDGRNGPFWTADRWSHSHSHLKMSQLTAAFPGTSWNESYSGPSGYPKETVGISGPHGNQNAVDVLQYWFITCGQIKSCTFPQSTHNYIWPCP